MRGPNFDLRVFGDVFQQAIHFRAAHILVRHFRGRGWKIMAFTLKPSPRKRMNLVLSYLIIVLGGGRPEFYFLNMRTLLMLLLLVELFLFCS